MLQGDYVDKDRPPLIVLLQGKNLRLYVTSDAVKLTGLCEACR